MLPQEIPSRQRENVVFFDETRRQRTLASAGLSKHDEAQRPSMATDIPRVFQRVLRSAPQAVEEERNSPERRRRRCKRP